MRASIPLAVLVLACGVLGTPADDDTVPGPPAAPDASPEVPDTADPPTPEPEPGIVAGPKLAVEEADGSLAIRMSDETIATYVYKDESILRPYFANVHATSGELVTRHHPPREGMDLTDHNTMHPGIWLGFGDISGADFWRNKATIEHVEFVAKPKVEKGVLSFAVRNRYVSGEKTVCTEVCHHSVRPANGGWLLTYDSRFSGEQLFVFGDQEEMGLGVRVATPLRVSTEGGGEIVNAEGLKNEKDVWGKTSGHVFYGGVVDERRLGLLVVPHPDNFRKSWFHARDYGFVAANPFGRKAFMAGEPSRVTVKPGETFRLRYGVLVHSTPATTPLDATVGAKQYVEATKETTAPVMAADTPANGSDTSPN